MNILHLSSFKVLSYGYHIILLINTFIDLSIFFSFDQFLFKSAHTSVLHLAKNRDQ